MKQQKLLAAILCAATPLAYAASDTLDEIVVTVTRTAQSADATLASVSIITRQDIERLQAQSLPDVLRGVAGLTLSNNGGAGKATSVFLRGTNADHVLVLIDGVKVGSATTGTAAFQDIPVAQIERIEIVRGPRASLYGSEAIGGVIQIFTRKGGGVLTPSFSVTAGSYGTLNGTAGLSGGGAQGWFNARLNQQETGGFNACRGSLVAACFTIEPDNDGYRNLSLGLNGGYRFDNGVIADVQALHASSKSKFDGSSVNEMEGIQQVLGGSLKFAPAQAWNMTLRAGSSQDDANNFKNGLFKTRFNTQRDSLTWQNDFIVNSDQLLTAGLDYQNDSVDSTTAYTRSTRDNRALFGQYQGSFGAHSLQASVRHDGNQQFGDNNTGGLSYGYVVNDSMRLMASYGTAFKAPTFNQLYYPLFGSATLRPELSRSIEAGVDGHEASYKWSLHAYQTDVTDLIGYNTVPPYSITNINTARLEGVEGQLSMRLAECDIHGTLTLQNPQQTSGANQGKLLNRRATGAARIDMSHDFGTYRLASSLYAEGRRFDDLANTQRLGGYALLDVRAEYRIATAWLAQGRIDNVLDKQYETALFFNQPRRGVYFTLNYQPKI